MREHWEKHASWYRRRPRCPFLGVPSSLSKLLVHCMCPSQHWVQQSPDCKQTLSRPEMPTVSHGEPVSDRCGEV